ncbi:hypothetical protein AABM17_642 [Neisseria musculi]|uniref:Uncharacterized protein n=1 Tax=Neisseria musculi TaxID=1815583 RepID=A0A7H1M917_9NEIS|nr:hypothetical protein H7A79_0642 [Neisseria musculi]
MQTATLTVGSKTITAYLPEHPQTSPLLLTFSNRQESDALAELTGGQPSMNRFGNTRSHRGRRLVPSGRLLTLAVVQMLILNGLPLTFCPQLKNSSA